MINKSRGWSNLVIACGVILVVFAIPHLIDDFLFDIPEEFHLSNAQAQILSGIFTAILIMIFALAAREMKSGYIGASFLGGFLALAVILKHLPKILQPAPYWSGFFSEFLILGLMFSGILLMVVSLLALKHRKP